MSNSSSYAEALRGLALQVNIEQNPALASLTNKVLQDIASNSLVASRFNNRQPVSSSNPMASIYGGGDVASSALDISGMRPSDVVKQVESLLYQPTDPAVVMEHYKNIEQMKVISEIGRMTPHAMLEQYQMLQQYNQMMSYWMQSQNATTSLAMLTNDVIKRTHETALYRQHQQMMNPLSSYKNSTVDNAQSHTKNICMSLSQQSESWTNQVVPNVAVPTMAIYNKRKNKVKTQSSKRSKQAPAVSSVSLANASSAFMDIAPSISNPQSLITEQTPTSQRECFVEESSPDNVWSSVVKDSDEKSTKESNFPAKMLFQKKPPNFPPPSNQMKQFMESLGLCTQQIKQELLSAQFFKSIQQSLPQTDENLTQSDSVSSLETDSCDTCTKKQTLGRKEAQLLVKSLGLQNLDHKQKKVKNSISKLCDKERQLRQQRIKQIKQRRRSRTASGPNIRNKEALPSKSQLEISAEALMAELKKSEQPKKEKALSPNFARDFHDLVFNATFRNATNDGSGPDSSPENIGDISNPWPSVGLMLEPWSSH